MRLVGRALAQMILCGMAERAAGKAPTRGRAGLCRSAIPATSLKRWSRLIGKRQLGEMQSRGSHKLSYVLGPNEKWSCTKATRNRLPRVTPPVAGLVSGLTASEMLPVTRNPILGGLLK